MICAIKPAFFHGVGQFQEDFSQTTDEEVRELLAEARATKEPNDPIRGLSGLRWW